MDDGLYPPIEPYEKGMLSRDGHALYYELSGNPSGPTALFLHGGPGGGTSPRVRRFFDPAHYRIVLLDQRGSGLSVPNVSDAYDAALRDNTTAHLVDDIEALREALDLDVWQLILGGSWGSTLAIAYAEAHPDRVRQLLLRGIFTFLPDEVDTLFQDGRVANHYPDEWEAYTGYIRRTSTNWACEQQNLVGAYQARLQDPAQRLDAAKAFVTFELSISHLHQNAERIESTMQNPAQLVPFAALEVHYMLHGGFMRRGQLLDHVGALRNHRIHIVHGRNDTVCLPRAAHRLVQALRAAGAGDNVTLEYIEAAGHSDSEPRISKALRTAADALARETSSP
ncbi:MAG TPA: prolyl aminopeptidase [Deltaproteobacteria bacterium]|nr:prolyl aminopeptidase [Deltaproteobacteria bacterium]